jgi:flagellar protein FliO/FliZ
MNTCNTFLLPFLRKDPIIVNSSRYANATKHSHRIDIVPARTGRLLVTLLLGCGGLPASATTSANASPISDGGMLQVMLGLVVVLAVIAGAAWLLRRFGGMARGPASLVKVIGGSAVGQRERVVLVEVGDTWLVIGVAPGHVTALHSMPKGESTASTSEHMAYPAGDARFSAWFKQVMEKRNGK